MGINGVVASGNLTRDAELRFTAKGFPVLAFCLAVNERRKSTATGEWEDNPVFVDCTLFGARGEALAPYLAKGSKVAIEGHMHQSRWQDKDTGKNRSKIEVIVQEIDPAWRRGEAEPPDAFPGAAAPSVYDQDIPF